MSFDEYFEANRANWNDRVGIHLVSKSYDVPAFLAGKSSLRDVDLAEMGSVRGKRLVHLQCHFGMDTLSWAREGAVVTGLDFSPSAVVAARELAAEAGIVATFVEANVYDALTVLEPGSFDIVFTGIGALTWLPDTRGWAKVVAGLLAPGGVFYIREVHPVLWAVDDTVTDERIVLRHSYFHQDDPFAWDDDQTYTDNPEGIPLRHTRTYDWNHTLGDVVSSLIDAGLTIDFLHEWDYCEYQALPWMVQEEDGRWVLPEGRERLPMLYSLRAHKG